MNVDNEERCAASSTQDASPPSIIPQQLFRRDGPVDLDYRAWAAIVDSTSENPATPQRMLWVRSIIDQVPRSCRNRSMVSEVDPTVALPAATLVVRK